MSWYGYSPGGYERMRDDWRVSQKLNSTGSDWAVHYGKDLSWKGSERSGELVGEASAVVHWSYKTERSVAVPYRGELYVFRSNRSYGNTTSKHDRSIWDLVGYGKLSIGIEEEKLQELAAWVIQKYAPVIWKTGKKRERLPRWAELAIEHKIRAERIRTGEIEGFKFKISYTQFGKIKKLCGSIQISHPSFGRNYRDDGYQERYLSVRKNEFENLDRIVDIPATVRAKLLMALENYHNFKTAHTGKEAA